MVLRARCIVTAAELGTGGEAGPFLVSDGPCPDVVPVLGSVLSTPGLCDADACGGLSVCPPAVAPAGSQLVLWGESAAAPPSCCGCCLVRINPLLPVTEPCGGSVSNVPFSFTSSSVLLLAAAAGLVSCTSSHSVPFSMFWATGDEVRLAAASVSPSRTPDCSSALLTESQASFVAGAPLSTSPLAGPVGSGPTEAMVPGRQLRPPRIRHTDGLLGSNSTPEEV